MKKIITLTLSIIGMISVAQAGIFRESCRIPVSGSKTIDLQQTLSFTPHCQDEVITELGLTVENAYRPGLAHFTINGIELVHAEIPAERGAQRIYLPLPFKVQYERDLDIRVRFDGHYTVSDVGLSLSGERFDRRPVREVVAPPPVVYETRTIQADRWATRYNGKWCERVRSLNDRGAGARDGWDYPSEGMIRDGRTANYQAGYQQTLLHAYLPPLDRDRLDRATIRVTAAGSGYAEVGFVSSGRTIRTQRIRLDSQLQSQEVTFDKLGVSRSGMGRLEVWVKSSDRRAMQVDAIEMVEQRERPALTSYHGRR